MISGKKKIQGAFELSVQCKIWLHAFYAFLKNLIILHFKYIILYVYLGLTLYTNPNM